LLFADKNNNSSRQKVAFKCTPNVNSLNKGKKGEKNINKLASIKKLPLLILAKLSKEVKEISKFFKMTSSATGTRTVANHMHKNQNQKTTQEKFSELRRLFQTFRQRKSKTYRKSSMVTVKLN